MRLFFLLIICCQFSFSQNSGIVTYKVLMPENQKSKGTDLESIFREIREKGEKFVYKLKFNATQSHFYLDEEMSLEIKEDDKASSIALILIGKSNYYDKQKLISINEVGDGNFIEDKPNKEWEISTESKRINEYICYKATSVKTTINKKQPKTVIITAWFAPSLPYSFGPKGYNGLPGLVLELNENNAIFYVDKIEIKEEPIEIKFPKSNVLTIEEYLKNSDYLPK